MEIPDDIVLQLRMIIPGALACVVIAWVIWRLQPVPYHRTSLREAQFPYSTETVSHWTIYHVWCSNISRGQEFVVLRIVDGYMLIAVFNPDWLCRKRKQRFAFKGWAKKICHDRLISPEDLLPVYPRQKEAWKKWLIGRFNAFIRYAEEPYN